MIKLFAVWQLTDKFHCYTSLLKYVFRLEENASRRSGKQNWLFPLEPVIKCLVMTGIARNFSSKVYIYVVIDSKGK